MEGNADKLVALLKPIPEAKRGIAHVETVVRNSKAVRQPDGWRVDARAVLDDPLTGASGLWQVAGDWLVGLARPDWTDGEALYYQVPMMLPKNFEITGQVAAEGHLCPHLDFMLFWNNNLKCKGKGVHSTNPFVSLPWTKPPGEKRTPAQEKLGVDFVNRMKNEMTFSFCLRKVGTKAAVFINGVDGPLANYEFPEEISRGQHLGLHQNCPHGLFMFRAIHVRAIDPGTDLNAPVKLPELKPVPPIGDLKDIYGRAEKIKAEMDKDADK
jgi:hypothetical protein